MPRLVSREFDQARPTYARRTFISNGRRYKSGDLFDWRRIALSVRKAKQLFDSGHLGHLNDDKPVEPVVEVKPAEIEVEDNEILAAVVDGDELDEIDDMKELRVIADAEGAPYKVSKADQRQAIRDNRKESI
jgi:hypothetical protein